MGECSELGNMVCSMHFLAEDFVVTNIEQHAQEGAVNTQVCRICLATHCKLYSMTTFNILNEAYETLIGYSLVDKDHLPPYLCGSCAERLMNCFRFRSRILRAHLILLDIFNIHGVVTEELVQSVIGNQSSHSSSSVNDQNDRCDTSIEDLEEVQLYKDEQASTSLRNDKTVKIQVENDEMFNQDTFDTETKTDDCIGCPTTYRQIDQYTSDIEDLQKLQILTNEQACPRRNIKVEIDDVFDQDSNNMEIKTDDDDYSLEVNNLDQEHAYTDAEENTRLKNTTVNVIKTEISDAINQGLINSENRREHTIIPSSAQQLSNDSVIEDLKKTQIRTEVQVNTKPRDIIVDGIKTEIKDVIDQGVVNSDNRIENDNDCPLCIEDPFENDFNVHSESIISRSNNSECLCKLHTKIVVNDGVVEHNDLITQDNHNVSTKSLNKTITNCNIKTENNDVIIVSSYSLSKHVNDVNSGNCEMTNQDNLNINTPNLYHDVVTAGVKMENNHRCVENDGIINETNFNEYLSIVRTDVVTNVFKTESGDMIDLDKHVGNVTRNNKDIIMLSSYSLNKDFAADNINAENDGTVNQSNFNEQLTSFHVDVKIESDYIINQDNHIVSTSALQKDAVGKRENNDITIMSTYSLNKDLDIDNVKAENYVTTKQSNFSESSLHADIVADVVDTENDYIINKDNDITDAYTLDKDIEVGDAAESDDTMNKVKLTVCSYILADDILFDDDTAENEIIIKKDNLVKSSHNSDEDTVDEFGSKNDVINEVKLTVCSYSLGEDFTDDIADNTEEINDKSVSQDLSVKKYVSNSEIDDVIRKENFILNTYYLDEGIVVDDLAEKNNDIDDQKHCDSNNENTEVDVPNTNNDINEGTNDSVNDVLNTSNDIKEDANDFNEDTNDYEINVPNTNNDHINEDANDSEIDMVNISNADINEDTDDIYKDGNDINKNVNGIICSANLFEYTVNNVISSDDIGMIDRGSLIEEDSNDVEFHSFIFVGKNVLGNPTFSQERQKGMFSTQVENVRMVPKEINDVKIENEIEQAPAADGELSAGDKLCCDTCAYETVSAIQLLEHLKAHAGALTYYCDLCDYKTICKNSLNRHIQGIHLEAHIMMYYCSQCNYETTSKEKLKIHTATHLSKKPYSCDVCSRKFKFKSIYEVHKKMHSGATPYSCCICDKSFNTDTDLKGHLEVHSSTKPYSCKSCGKRFRNTDKLKEHSRVHIKPHMCSICGKRYSGKNCLRSHMLVHAETKSYSCLYCRKTFASVYELGIHFRVHSNEKPFSCDVCYKGFTEESTFRTHFQIHSSEEIPMLRCELCTYKTISEMYLLDHLKAHAAAKSFHCHLCKFETTSRNEINTHIDSHSGAKRFSCHLCDKTLCNKAKLDLHMRIHTGEKPFECVVCKKRFSRDYNLRTHYKTHYQQDTFFCILCQKIFKHRNSLAKHIRVTH